MGQQNNSVMNTWLPISQIQKLATVGYSLYFHIYTHSLMFIFFTKMIFNSISVAAFELSSLNVLVLVEMLSVSILEWVQVMVSHPEDTG